MKEISFLETILDFEWIASSLFLATAKNYFLFNLLNEEKTPIVEYEKSKPALTWCSTEESVLISKEELAILVNPDGSPSQATKPILWFGLPIQICKNNQSISSHFL